MAYDRPGWRRDTDQPTEAEKRSYIDPWRWGHKPRKWVEDRLGPSRAAELRHYLDSIDPKLPKA